VSDEIQVYLRRTVIEWLVRSQWRVGWRHDINGGTRVTTVGKGGTTGELRKKGGRVCKQVVGGEKV